MASPVNVENNTNVQTLDSELQNNGKEKETQQKIESTTTEVVGATTSSGGDAQNNEVVEGQDNANADFPDSDEEVAHYMDQPELIYYDEYKDCDCCKGHVYNCEGEVCQEIGECYCYGLNEPQ
mmetsp:Transcript_25607/g.29756  ORF Transcript_25607/g.29756 Transcript_25607/m.29756 type:complete len:123 (-) Transcript_25607:190-558(-)